MKISKFRIIMNIAFLCFSIFLFFFVFHMHEYFLQKAEPFAGQEVRNVDWWIKSYNQYYLMASIFIASITCLSFFIAINLNSYKREKITYLLMIICIWIGLCNLSIIIWPFLPLIFCVFTFLGVSGLSLYLLIKHRTIPAVKPLLVFIVMMLYVVNNIWCMGRYFDLFGD